MATQVRVPPPLRALTHGQRIVKGDGATLRELVADLDQQYPGFKDKLCTQDGALRKFLSIYINGERLDSSRIDSINVNADDDVAVIFTLAGG